MFEPRLKNTQFRFIKMILILNIYIDILIVGRVAFSSSRMTSVLDLVRLAKNEADVVQKRIKLDAVTVRGCLPVAFVLLACPSSFT